jgi:hypothetical protein
LVSGGGDGVDVDGNKGGALRLVIVFDFVLFGAEFFGLTRDAFGAVGFAVSAPLATTGTSPLAAMAPVCGTTCVPARRRLRTLVDETMVTTSTGVVGVAGALATA